MRKWKTNSGDSIEKFAIAAGCGDCSCTSCRPCTCRPTPTHDVGEQSMNNTNTQSSTSAGALYLGQQ